MRARSRAPTTSLALPGQLAALLDDLRRQAGVEAVLGVVGLVLGFVVEELALGNDADRRQRLFFQQADGQLRAADELLDQCLAVPREHLLHRVAACAGSSAGALQTNTSMLLPLLIALTTHGAGDARRPAPSAAVTTR